MKGVIIHGGLLVVALILGYQTWTRDKTVDSKVAVGDVEVWNKPVTALKSVSWETPERTTRVERRGDGADAYVWGVESKTTKKPVKPPVKKPEADAAEPAVPPPAPETVTTTREFPLNDDATTLVKNMASLKALRALGTLDEKKLADYDLDDSTTTLNVAFDDGVRSLIVGGKTEGSDDRFVLDSQSNKAYVLAKAVVASLGTGETALRLKEVHGFKDDDLTGAEVAIKDQRVSLVRNLTKDGEGKQTKTWAQAASPTTPDQTMANFLKRIGDLRPSKYEVEIDAATLEELVTVKYLVAGKEVGFVTLYKRTKDAAPVTPATPATPATAPAPDAATADATAPVAAEPPAPKPEVEYFLKTERTRVVGAVVKTSADRVEQDLAELVKQ